MATKNHFTSDYKKEIVKLITELGNKPSDVAEYIGVTATTIKRWVKQYSIHADDAFLGKGDLRPTDERLRELMKITKELEKENAILRKAMAIFTKHVK